MTSLKVKPLSACEYQSWFCHHRRFLHNRTPFHQPAWLDAVDQGSRCRVAFLGLWQGSDITAALPIFLTRRGPFRLAGSPLRGAMTSYLGPVALDGELLDASLPCVLTLCRDAARAQWKTDYFEVTMRDAPAQSRESPNSGPATKESDVSSLQTPALDSHVPPHGLPPAPNHRQAGPGGWIVRRPLTYRLDLRTGPDAVWTGMKGRARRSIRQAQRAGVTVVPFDDPAAYCRMHGETFARHGRPAPHPRRFFQAIFDCLAAHDIAWAAAALHEDVALSAGIFVHDDQETLYVSGASSSDRRPLSAGHLLHWHIIQQAASQGHAWYDLVGRGIPSIDHFKESFNPDIVTCWSVSWSTRSLRLAESAVALGGSLVARAPHIKHRV